jgi:hypothetical protein
MTEIENEQHLRGPRADSANLAEALNDLGRLELLEDAPTGHGTGLGVSREVEQCLGLRGRQPGRAEDRLGGTEQPLRGWGSAAVIDSEESTENSGSGTTA